MLEIAELHAYYGKSHVLQGVDLDVGAGEIVALLGRNGVGRSTTCKAIMGLVHARGSINYRGREIVGLRTDEIAHLGLGYVPEDRQIFPTLTVRQNLELGLKQKGRFGRWTYDDISSVFPICANASTMQLGYCQAASSKCLQFAAHSWEILISLSWTSRRRGSHLG